MTAALKLSEQAFQAQTVETAQRLGWAVARFPSRNTRTAKGGRVVTTKLLYDTKGWPDVTFVRERIVVVEFKAAGEPLEHEQAVWLDRLLQAGVEAYVARAADAAAVTEALTWRLTVGKHYGLLSQTLDEVARVLGKATA